MRVRRNTGWRAYDVAWIYHNRANTDEAARWADRCAEAWARGGSEGDQAGAMHMRGLVVQQRKEYHTAERLFQDILAIYRDLRDNANVSRVLNDLGELERSRRDYDAAERYYREALTLAEKHGDKGSQSTYNTNLGEIALGRQRWAEAREVGRQALIAAAYDGLACVHEAEQHPELALPLAQEAAAIRQRLQYKDLAETGALGERLRKTVDGQ